MSDHSAAQKAALAVGAFAAAVAVGAIYVTVHESRRKAKKAKKEAAQKGERSSDGLSAEQLIAVLKESACAAYQLIEQTRKMVHEKHVQTGQPLEQCVDELQKNFESAMETVIGSIRAKHGVSEQQMTASMVANTNVAEVAQAVTELREAMNGKAPPGYTQRAEEQAAEAAKQRVRRNGKSRRKG